MNRSFLIIFIPAVFVAAMYLFLGIYPPGRVLIGIAVLAAGFAAYGIRVWLKRGKAAAQPAPPAPPAASHTPPAGQP
jgi:hypothetical protein